MKDREKDKEQLLNELMKLRTKITKLEHVKANYKQTEKELAKSEELFSLIVENTSDVITLTILIYKQHLLILVLRLKILADMNPKN